MKKKLMLLLGIMLFLIIVGAIIIKMTTPKEDIEVIKEEDKLKVVTTFYPIYMIGLNIAGQEETIEVKSLTDLNTGCLHDYQLTTEDMKIISAADVMVINGGGMEGFLEDVVANYPQLTIIDASQGIPMLLNDSHTEDLNENSKEEGSDDRDEYNPHIWLDPKLYIMQIENVKEGFIEYLKETTKDLPDITRVIEENAQTYIIEVMDLDSEITETMKSLELTSEQVTERQAVVFHDAFAYLANRVGMKVAFTVPLDSDTALSAGDIAEIISAVREDKTQYLFTEQQYSDSIAKQIEAETEAKVYIIDSAVTGDGSKDSYLKAMNKNLDVLKQTLK
jgi:zinc transport system substrate-binding protein